MTAGGKKVSGKATKKARQASKQASPRQRAKKTPVRAALRDGSALQPLVQDGFSAVKAAERDCFHPGIRATFSDSLDLDAAMLAQHPVDNRWDYLLGHASSGQVVAVEPHTAKTDEITTLINKRRAARAQLQEHLRDGARVAKWLWVTSGRVQFADTERARRQLDQHGIEFVGTQVLDKHLPAARAAGVQAKKGK